MNAGVLNERSKHTKGCLFCIVVRMFLLNALCTLILAVWRCKRQRPWSNTSWEHQSHQHTDKQDVKSYTVFRPCRFQARFWFLSANKTVLLYFRRDTTAMLRDTIVCWSSNGTEQPVSTSICKCISSGLFSLRQNKIQTS